MHNKVRGSDSAATAPRWLQFGHAIAISAMIQPSEEEALGSGFTGSGAAKQRAAPCFIPTRTKVLRDFALCIWAWQRSAATAVRGGSNA